MAVPVVIGSTDHQAITTSGTVALPTNTAVGDYVVVMCETANQAVGGVTSSGTTTFSELIAPTGAGTAGAAGAVRLTVYGALMVTEADTTSVTLTNAGDHINWRAITLRGVNPNTGLNLVAARIDSAGSFSMAWPSGQSTTDNDCIILCGAAFGDDANSTTRVSGFTAANLANIVEQWDQVTNTATGGGLCLYTGELATAGAIGAPTATAFDDTKHDFILLAFTGTSPATPIDLATETAVRAKTYTGPDKEGTTRTRNALNGHYLHGAARMMNHKEEKPTSGGNIWYWEGLEMGAFCGVTAEKKWFQVEYEDGVFDFTEIKGLLEVCAEQRMYAYLNFEWKHFDTGLYGDVAPHYALEAETGVIAINFTASTTTLNSLDPQWGDLIVDGTSGAKGYLLGGLKSSADAYRASGTIWIDVLSGTFGNGRALKVNNQTIATSSSAPTAVVGTQTLIGQDGIIVKVHELYVANRIQRLIDACMTEFGHHPWFAGFETPEAAGTKSADGLTTTLRTGESYNRDHTYKANAGTTYLTQVHTDGNTLYNNWDEGGYGYCMALGRILRDHSKKWPHLACIMSANLFPNSTGPAGGLQIAFDAMLTPDGVAIPATDNVLVGGPDILYENPARTGLNKNSYPNYRRNGIYGMDVDGTTVTTISNAKLPNYRHKVAMQHDSQKPAENGGLEMSLFLSSMIDYLDIDLVQWNFEKTGNVGYAFSDQKAYINAIPQPTPNASYTPPTVIGRRLTTTGPHNVNTTNGFPVNGTNPENAFSFVFRFYMTNWAATTEDLLISGANFKIIYDAGDIILTAGTGTGMKTITIANGTSESTNTRFAQNTATGGTQYGTICVAYGHSDGNFGNGTTTAADQKISMIAINSRNSNATYGATTGTITRQLGTTFTLCNGNAGGSSSRLHSDGILIIGRRAAGITANSRELGNMVPTQAIG